MVSCLSNLLAGRNRGAWRGSVPPRQLGQQFFFVVERFSRLAAASFRLHMRTGELDAADRKLSYAAANMGKTRTRETPCDGCVQAEQLESPPTWLAWILPVGQTCTKAYC